MGDLGSRPQKKLPSEGRELSHLTSSAYFAASSEAG